MSPERVSSRLATREQKKLVSQTILMFFGAIAVILLFIFVILPGFIKIINAVFGGGQDFEVSDSFVPQVPIINTPLEATSSASLIISGYGEPESQITTTLNGQEDEKVTVKEDGTFEMTITLSEGENAFTLFATDGADNESSPTKKYVVFLDTVAPALEVTSPEDGQSIVGKANQSIKVTGRTDEQTKIFVNNRAVYPDSEGNFEYPLRLEEGANTVVIKAVDRGGNTTEQTKSVIFSL
jgi:hypothetical protein